MCVPDEIRAKLVDHLINQGLTMDGAGQRVQANVGRTTVSLIRTGLAIATVMYPVILYTFCNASYSSTVFHTMTQGLVILIALICSLTQIFMK